MSYYQCDIKFKDDDTIFESIVKDSVGIIEGEDDKIFYYCEGLTEIESLTKEDNEEDFIILSYVKTEMM